MAVVFSSLPGPGMWEVQYGFPAVAWALLVGGNVASTLVRFPALIRIWSVGGNKGAPL